MKKVIVVIGKVCAGKDTFAHQHIDRSHIDIGSIVRKLTESTERTHNHLLDEDIINVLDEEFTRDQVLGENNQYIVTGIRQLSILNFIRDFFGRDNVQMIYLEVPSSELKRRFAERNGSKDNQLTFEQVIERDDKLGLGDVERWLSSNKELVTVIQNH